MPAEGIDGLICEVLTVLSESEECGNVNKVGKEECNCEQWKINVCGA